ncbi:MAG: NAD(P)-dependent alcohol dehydrogenase [Bacteriovoracia bacterium]
MTQSYGYAAQSAKSPLAPFSFQRRNPGPKDVLIEIQYSGVCHSDIHQARDEWGRSHFPMVPGHEIVGKITAVGSNVTKFKVGDLAGVGCMVDSCRTCANCKEGLEQYCENGFSPTYNGTEQDKKTPTYGGYSNCIVTNEDFTLRVPSNLDLSKVAPLLCAGITTYSPLRHWKVSKGQKVGIVGLGGLGHMGVKFANALGSEVTVFTTSPNKVEDARRLGAHQVVISKDQNAMQSVAGQFDFILNTVSAPHNVNEYLRLLKLNGTMVLVGVPDKAPELEAFSLIARRRQLAGSLIGGIAETQEMLDFCGSKNITSEVELIPIQKINEAYERTIKADVKYRFVIDMKSLKV